MSTLEGLLSQAEQLATATERSEGVEELLQNVRALNGITRDLLFECADIFEADVGQFELIADGLYSIAERTQAAASTMELLEHERTNIDHVVSSVRGRAADIRNSVLSEAA